VDGQNVRGPAEVRHENRERCRRRRHRRQREDFTWPARTTVDAENMARDAFARIDEIHNNSSNTSDGAGMDAVFAELEGQFDEANLEHMIQESTQTVYGGSSQNRLQCAIVLFTLCILYSVP
jgi:hypothetical protein